MSKAAEEANRDRLELCAELEAGTLTLREAVGRKAARMARVEDLVRATAERGSRQTPALCRRAAVAPWLEMRHAKPEQIERLLEIVEDPDG